MDWNALAKASIALFAVINPIGSIPLFLQFTHHMEPPERDRAFRTGVLSAALILFGFLIAGERVLTGFFQIEINDLMAAGGLLLLIIAIDHLVFGSLVKGVMQGEEKEAHHIGAVPIACPVLAGPGAMMTVLLSYSSHGAVVAGLSILVVLGITWAVLAHIETVYRLLGRTICTVLGKIFCLFIAAIGMRLLMQGLKPYLQAGG